MDLKYYYNKIFFYFNYWYGYFLHIRWYRKARFLIFKLNTRFSVRKSRFQDAVVISSLYIIIIKLVYKLLFDCDLGIIYNYVIIFLLIGINFHYDNYAKFREVYCDFLRDNLGWFYLFHGSVGPRNFQDSTRGNRLTMFMIRCLIFLRLIVLSAPVLFAILKFVVINLLLLNVARHYLYLINVVLIFSRITSHISDLRLSNFKLTLKSAYNIDLEETRLAISWKNAVILAFWALRDICETRESRDIIVRMFLDNDNYCFSLPGSMTDTVQEYYMDLEGLTEFDEIEFSDELECHHYFFYQYMYIFIICFLIFKPESSGELLCVTPIIPGPKSSFLYSHLYPGIHKSKSCFTDGQINHAGGIRQDWYDVSKVGINTFFALTSTKTTKKLLLCEEKIPNTKTSVAKVCLVEKSHKLPEPMETALSNHIKNNVGNTFEQLVLNDKKVKVPLDTEKIDQVKIGNPILYSVLANLYRKFTLDAKTCLPEVVVAELLAPVLQGPMSKLERQYMLEKGIKTVKALPSTQITDVSNLSALDKYELEYAKDESLTYEQSFLSSIARNRDFKYWENHKRSDDLLLEDSSSIVTFNNTDLDS